MFLVLALRPKFSSSRLGKDDVTVSYFDKNPLQIMMFYLRLRLSCWILCICASIICSKQVQSFLRLVIKLILVIKLVVIK